MAITFNHNTSVISLTAPETNLLLMQDLIDAIRVEEQSELGIQYPSIAEATGKTDLGGGVISDITITLLDSWQIEHLSGSYQAVIKGGQIVGGLGGNPIKYIAGVQVKMIQSTAGIIATVTTGSGVTEQDKLDIADKVWDELMTDHTIQDSFSDIVNIIKSSQINKRVTNEILKTITLYKDDGNTILKEFDYSENNNGEIISIIPKSTTPS